MKIRVFQDGKQKKRLGARKCPWSVEWRENGRRRSKAIGAKADANTFAAVKRAELEAGAKGLLKHKRWADFAEEYDRLKVANMRSHESRRLTRQILRTFAESAKPQWVHLIDSLALDEYVAKRLQMPGRIPGDKVSPGTVRKDLRTVRAALNVAKDWGYVRDMPKMPRVLGHTPDKGFMLEEHFDDIMAACDVARKPDPRLHPDLPGEPADWWRALLATAWVTGMRIGALLALRWEDVDLDRCLVWSRAHDNKGKRDLRHDMGGAAELLRDIQGPDPRVFPWNHCRRSIDLVFHAIQKAAGIDLPCRMASGNPEHTCSEVCHLYGWHDIRRAHATYNYGKVTDRALQQQMGHASFQTTQLYIKYAELHQADAYPAHLPGSLQRTHEAAKQRENSGKDDGKPSLRVVAAG